MNRRIEEQQAIKQHDQAFKNYMDAHFALLHQFSPIGNGALTEESMDMMSSAEAQLRVAEANLTRLAKQ